MRTLYPLAGLVALFSLSTGSLASTIDFSTNNGVLIEEGDSVLNFDFGSGVSGNLATIGGINLAWVYDTNGNTGADPDLKGPFEDVDNAGVFSDFGNALIIQENSTVPADDNAGGGTMTFSFDVPIFIGFVDLLDIEELTSIFINGVLAASGQTDNAGLPNDGPNQFKRLALNIPNVSVMAIEFGGSGAIGQFSVSAPVPIPPALPLFASALAALGLAGWRRRRGATA